MTLSLEVLPEAPHEKYSPTKAMVVFFRLFLLLWKTFSMKMMQRVVTGWHAFDT